MKQFTLDTLQLLMDNAINSKVIDFEKDQRSIDRLCELVYYALLLKLAAPVKPVAEKDLDDVERLLQVI